jgi:hypothetical protein
MAIDNARIFEMEQSTLDELRQIVEATADLPGGAVVRTKSVMEIDIKRGARIQSVRIAPGETR